MNKNISETGTGSLFSKGKKPGKKYTGVLNERKMGAGGSGLSLKADFPL